MKMKVFFLVFILFSFFSFSEEKNVVAKVNGVEITSKELNSQVGWLKNQLLMRGMDLKQIPEEKIKEQALQSLIEMELAYQEAKSKKFTAKKEEIQSRLDNFKKRFKEEKEYNDYLKQQGMNEDEMRKEIEREIIVNKYIDEVILKDFKSASEEEIKKFYDENPSYFIKPEQVKASHILVSVPENATEEQKKEARKKAEGILKDLKKGANFEEVAKEKSDCPSKQRGGDLGYFPKGRMVKPFEDVAFSLKPGVLSDIVETKFGYHIILVKDHKMEEKAKLEEVKENIKAYLDEGKKQDLVQKKLSELLPKAKIENYLEKEHKH
jgi:peptidyl-prolyl cis-trans isomerase C